MILCGGFKPVIKNKRTIGFIGCEKQHTGRGFDYVYIGYKYQKYKNGSLYIASDAFDLEIQARVWIKKNTFT